MRDSLKRKKEKEREKERGRREGRGREGEVGIVIRGGWKVVEEEMMRR